MQEQRAVTHISGKVMDCMSIDRSKDREDGKNICTRTVCPCPEFVARMKRGR